MVDDTEGRTVITGAISSVMLLSGRSDDAIVIDLSSMIHTWADRRLPWIALPLELRDPRYDLTRWYRRPNPGIAETATPPGQSLDVRQAQRLALTLWFRQQVVDTTGPWESLEPRRAVLGAQTLVPDAGPALTAHLEALVRQTQLPVITDGATGDLDNRLRDWRIGEALQGDGSRVNAEISLGTQTDPADIFQRLSFVDTLDNYAAWRASRFSEADLRGLMALTSRTDINRWMDHGQPRSIGDQALRAIMSLIEVDPRVITGRDPTTPWTSAERELVVSGLSRWYAAHAHQSLEQMQVDLVPQIPLTALAHLLAMIDDDRRKPLLDAMVGAWSHGPPAGELEVILPFATGDSGFARLVDAWPVTGPQRALLATWHLRRGDRGPSRMLLDQALAVPANDPTWAQALTEALRVNAYSPDAAYVSRLQSMVGVRPLSAAAERLIIALPTMEYTPSDVLWSSRNESGYSSGYAVSCSYNLVQVLLLAQLLSNHQAASSRMVDLADVAWNVRFQLGSGAEPIRVCDVAASRMQSMLEQVLRFNTVKDVPSDGFPIRSTRAERDQAIERITVVIRMALPVLRGGLDLPIIIPGFDLEQEDTPVCPP